MAFAERGEPVKMENKTHTQTVGVAPAAQSRKVWAAAGLIVVAVSVAYANSFHGPFIFDDDPSIVENKSIRHLGSPQVLAAPSDAVTTTGRPVVNLSLAVNYAIGELNVEGYHAVNLAIHILAALTLFGLMRRTLLLPALSTRFGAASTGLAMAVTLLWALHPLQTESVTYVVQRAEALVGLFYLLTLYCLLRGATTKRGAAWYAAGVGACALGMASKEVMVSAPLVALMYDGIFVAGSFKEGLRRRRRFWVALSGTWALLALLVYLSLGRGGSAGFGMGMTVWQYARTQFGCIIHYLRLTFWPNPLVLDYGNDIVSSTAEIVPYVVGVLLLLTATAVALVRRPKLGFLGVWFFAILAPTSSIVPLAGQTEAEHRMYLPLVAVVALVVLAAYRAVGRLGPRSRQTAVALIAACAGTLGFATYRRNENYQSKLAIWNYTVLNCPLNHRAYNNRGNAYLAMGQYDAAIKDYDKSIELKPRYANTYDNRAKAYRAEGRFDEAIRDYDKAIKLKPDSEDAIEGRSEAYVAKGQQGAVIKDLDKAIELNPSDAKAYNKRGKIYGGEGRCDEAIRDYQKAIKLNPDFADAYNNRGSAYGNMGQVDAAIGEFDRAIGLDPNFEEAYYNRGCAYGAKGRIDAAIKDYDKAIRLRPNYPEAYNSRGQAYDGKGQFDAAIKDYDRAIELRPDYAEAFNNRGGAYEAKGQFDAAISDCDKSIRLRPDQAEAYNNRGNAYQGKGQYGAAIQDYDRAIELNPKLAAAYQNRAIARSQTKDYDRAWADVRMFRKLGGTPSPSLIADLTKASGRLE
jgi:tetratricopeptide (TPR) repeat protein